MREVWRDVADRLSDNAIPTPETDARLLLAHATGLSNTEVITLCRNAIDLNVQATLDTFISRRLKGEPVSRIIGERGFWKHDFLISPATLDPRPDSETLVELTLKLVRHETWQDRKLSILDLGTGSGCLLLSVLDALPHARGLGVDISRAALEIAQQNAQRIGCADRVSFQYGNWFDGVDGPFDIILSNPPYIQSSDIDTLMDDVKFFDPRKALDGGHDGLDAYREIISRAREYLPSGWIVFEGGQGQDRDIASLLENAGFSTAPQELTHLADLGGITRCVAGRSHYSPSGQSRR